ncbi:MAG TPA: hypothetical protein PLK76_02720 [bacterium]|nr:hypothetical protein [bacterium]
MLIISFIALSIILLIIFYVFTSFILFFIYKTPFVPVGTSVVKKVFQQLDFKKGNIFYDLGSGDGRVLITASKNFGQNVTGLEINPFLCFWSKCRAGLCGAKIKIICGDLFKQDLSPANYIYMYLLPEIMANLENKIFNSLKKDALVISYKFTFPNHLPQQEILIKNFWGQHKFYIYKI